MRHPNLPSISTLLTRPPSPPIIVVNQDESPTYHISSSTLSPMLSPIDSYTSSNPSPLPISPLPSPSMLSLPNSAPLQGDDPPRRLRHPSVSSIGSISPKPSYNSLWSVGSSSPQSSYCSSPPTTRERSVSPMTERPPLPPSTQIILSESGQPILKRRRGRPPSLREPALEGGWTFLTPTVWDVKNPPSEETQVQQVQQAQQEQQLQQANTDSIMNGSMAAFTSSNMDMVLQMPRKKRGRKPKTHIVGNSCFVWKDITASRRSTKVQKQQESSSPRRLEQAPI